MLSYDEIEAVWMRVMILQEHLERLKIRSSFKKRPLPKEKKTKPLQPSGKGKPSLPKPGQSSPRPTGQSGDPTTTTTELTENKQ